MSQWVFYHQWMHWKLSKWHPLLLQFCAKPIDLISVHIYRTIETVTHIVRHICHKTTVPTVGKLGHISLTSHSQSKVFSAIAQFLAMWLLQIFTHTFTAVVTYAKLCSDDFLTFWTCSSPKWYTLQGIWIAIVKSLVKSVLSKHWQKIKVKLACQSSLVQTNSMTGVFEHNWNSHKTYNKSCFSLHTKNWQIW